MIAEVIHDPLARVLHELALDEATDTKHVTWWNLPDTAVDQLLDELVLRLCRGQYRYTVKCPLGFIKGKPGAVWQLADKIRLHWYSHRDIGRFLSRHYQKFPSHDLFSAFATPDTAILEIIQTYDLFQNRYKKPKLSIFKVDKEIKENISNLIDIIKWTFMICMSQSTPLNEGIIVFEDIIGGPISFAGIHSFRRQMENSGPVYKVAENHLNDIRELISQACRAHHECPDLRQAFWYWGRSSLAELDRDVLLEAAIGLEGLLVPNPGESRYRFGLHGAALLASTAKDAEVTARALREIYGERSSAAHGNSAKRSEWAIKARQYLGRAILSVMKLITAEVFQPSSGISKQLQTEVLKRAPLSQ